MNCYQHDHATAIGLCVSCQKALCRACVGRDQPRLVCRTCLDRGAVVGFEYRSAASIGPWPLIHVCTGVDVATMRPKVARGVVAIGNIAMGGLAIGGAAIGVVSIGGLSIGLLLALGGAALGVGLSIGGLAIGSVAIGGGAIGFMYAVGGGALGPAVIDGQRCDPSALDFVRQWFGFMRLPPSCQ